MNKFLDCKQYSLSNPGSLIEYYNHDLFVIQPLFILFKEKETNNVLSIGKSFENLII